MSAANEILKAALLGTDRYMPRMFDELKDISQELMSDDKEDSFLKIAAVALTYEEAGQSSVTTEAEIAPCPPETKTLATPHISDLARTFLFSKEDILFRYIIWHCNKSNRILSPAIIPDVLNKALEHKKSSGPLVEACGETGKWLCGLNENWKPLMLEEKGDNDWETGHIEARRQYFTALRKTDPAAALKLLEQSFMQETAANRVDFIELMKTGLSLADEPFLESLAKDKSQKVKDAANRMLAEIPGSALNRLFLDSILAIISVKEERHMLISKKKVLDIHKNPDLPEALYKAGIQKVSAEKGVDDTMFALGQLLVFADPTVLAARLNVTDAELIKLMINHKEMGILINFLVNSAIRSGNKAWTVELLQKDEVKNIELLNALSPAERYAWYDKFLTGQIGVLLQFLFDDNYTDIPLALAEKMLASLEKEPYQVTQPIYQRLALQLPAAILPKLQTLATEEATDYQKRYFKNQAQEMLRILELKLTISKQN